MRGLFFSAVLVVVVSFSATADAIELRVMSFNIKNGNPTTENRWEDRRPILARCVERQDPDLIGTQEGFFFQIKHMVEVLPQYDWVGLGRAGGSKDEMMAILYKKDRFEVMAFDHFWLSDTPEIIGSRTWGHDNRRMVTWVRFRDRESGIAFYHWNTHFDHRVQEAREKSAELILRRIRSLEGDPTVILTGDFNAAPDNPAYATLVSQQAGATNVRDTWAVAGERVGDGIGTFNGWRGPRDDGRRIDWILATPNVACRKIVVDTYEEGGQYPSDHFPVVADLVIASSEN